jgi:hypothetical protein
MVGRLVEPIVLSGVDRALQYLQFVQGFELESGMVNLFLREKDVVYPRLLDRIDWLNYQMRLHLQACQDCLFSENQRSVQILAAPLEPRLHIDGFCDIRANPITIVVDPGRIDSQDWLGLVVHEYAHAVTGTVGHGPKFAAILQHLCLGLGLMATHPDLLTEQQLCSYPPCRQTADPLAFWLSQQ